MRVSWNTLTTSNTGACCLSTDLPVQIYRCATGFTWAASSLETRQPFNLKKKGR